MRPLHSHFGGKAFVHVPDRPRKVANSTWQPGVIPKSERFKPLLNGEPVPGAFAAREGADGWVDCRETELMQERRGTRAPLGLAYRIDPFKEPTRLHGVVTLVPISDC